VKYNSGHRSLKITPNLNLPNPCNCWTQPTYVANETYVYPHLPLNHVQRHRKVEKSLVQECSCSTDTGCCRTGLLCWLALKCRSLIRKQKKVVLRKGVELGSETVCPIHWPTAQEWQCVTVLSELRFLILFYSDHKICSLLRLAS
jgi:hypothetical protein